MKLTKAQSELLDRMADKGRINFSSAEGQEIACQLDALGLAVAYTDSSNSLGLVIAAITQPVVPPYRSRRTDVRCHN